MIQHAYPFDATYGFDDAGLPAIVPPPCPPGFEDFWREHFDLASRIPPASSREPCPDLSTEQARVEVVRFWSLGLDGGPPVRVGGWLTTPTTGTVDRAEVVGHGYGGREGPDFANPQLSVARLFVRAGVRPLGDGRGA